MWTLIISPDMIQDEFLQIIYYRDLKTGKKYLTGKYPKRRLRFNSLEFYEDLAKFY